MAIYKPSNFYPNLQEIDLNNENIFSCQVNTDGSMVSAARLTISTEDNVLAYENLYQFIDRNGNKNSVENKSFIELPVEPYKIDNSNIDFYKKINYYIYDSVENVYYDEYGDNKDKIKFNTYDEAYAVAKDSNFKLYDKDGNQLYNIGIKEDVQINKKIISIKNIDFITLHPDISYDIRKDYCPYNFYNVKLKDAFCFGLKFVNSMDEDRVLLYPFRSIDYTKTDFGYDIKVNYDNDLLIDDISEYDCYVVLLNDKDYAWDIKMYEHLFGEDIDKGTLITDGYVTGSTKSVLWWDEKKQSDNTLFNRKEIKEDYYVEVVADKNNSDLFEEQIKMGRVSEGTLTEENIEENKNCLKFSENIIETDMYNMNNLFLRIDFINSKPKSNKIKSQNYFKIKKIIREDDTYIMLEDLDTQNLIFEFLKNPPKKYYRRAKESDDSYTYYDEYGDNKEKKYFETQDEANEIVEIISKTSTSEEIIKLTENIETEIIIDSIVSYAIVYKQREQITWITENVGFDKNINKIEVLNDFDINLKDGSVVDIYGGNNVNTNYSFFGVRDSDINVDDIYVRFPGYKGEDFNGELVNDIYEKYYNEKGVAEEVYGSNGELVKFSSDVGLKGMFYQEGSYYPDKSSAESSVKNGSWSPDKFQPVDMYGKNVPSIRFEKNEDTDIFGYLDFFNIKSTGTSYCNKGFAIEFNNCVSVEINGDISYSSSIPANGPDVEDGKYGVLWFYLDDDNEWSMCATSKYWSVSGNYGYSTSAIIWNFTNYPKVTLKNGRFYTPTYKEEIKNKYKIGKIKDIKIDFGSKKRIENYNSNIVISYYSNNDLITTLEQAIEGGTFIDTYLEYAYKTFIDAYANSSEYKTIKNAVSNTYNYMYFYPGLIQFKESYCKLFKVTSYDYETGEFIIAGGLGRSILNTDQYEVWQRTASETSKNEYNITEIDYSYTRIYPPHDKYDEVAYVGDTKILKNGVVIMNNNTEQIFIQPNVNFYSDEYNYPYLILDNYNQLIKFPYHNKIYDDGFTIKDRTINQLDGSQWLLNYNDLLDIIPKSGQTYKLYMDTCNSTPSNWFYGRNIANISMRVGEYHYINNQLKTGKVNSIDFPTYKESFNDIRDKKNGKYCLIQCVAAYFMATYDSLSVPIKRYRYKLYDSYMNLINDSGYIYDTYISYAINGFRNEETYLLSFEMEDQLGYVYTYEERLLVKYIEYNTNLIQLQLTNNSNQGCILGEFVISKEAKEDIVSNRDTYDEDGNVIKKGDIIKKGTIYFELCKESDFINRLSLNILENNDIYIYRRNKEKLLSFVCKINLTQDKIYTGYGLSEHKYGFIDYGVYNNEYYDYVAILKENDLTTDSHLGNMEYTYVESRCHTCFDGWFLVDIEKNESDNNYYVSDQIWKFKYNLESQDLSQNVSITKWDTLGKYANVNIGQKNYISSGLTCLLGDVGVYFTYDGNKLKEHFGYFEQSFENVNYDDAYNVLSNEILTNNIDKYNDWKLFNSNGNPKLLKDYKGNMWIVQIIENPSVKNIDNSNEQIYKISFSWAEIMDWKKYPILGKHISFDKDETMRIEIENILENWEYTYEEQSLFYNLVKLSDHYNNGSKYENSLNIIGGISLGNNSKIGILSESYTGKTLLEDGKEFLSSFADTEIEEFYNEKQNFISPLKIKEGEIYRYPSILESLYFENSLLYENNSIDFICCGMSELKKVNIQLTDAITSARYAFAGTSITTNEQYQIIINTNNYINTFGMLDDLQGDGKVVVKWGTLSDDPDLMTYAELYERYWNNDKIILDCKFNFNIDDWMIEPIKDEIGNIDGIDYTKKITLNSYSGSLTAVYIPKFFKDKNGNIYLIELSENFNI